MPWRYPTDDRHVPPGGEFLSVVLDNGKRRTLPHSGLDYSHWAGSPIYVIGPGTVVARGTNPRTGWGYHVWVDHGDIGDGSHAYSYYAHMKSLGPKVGTRYRGGEVIGAIGATGSGITGAHLHWGVALARPADLYKVTIMDAASRDYLIDPAAFVAANRAGTAGGGITPFPEPDPIYTEEDDMTIRVITHVDAAGTQEVALVCVEFPLGYILAKPGTAEALGWLRTYSPKLDGTPHATLNRDDYVGAIQAARAAAAAWQAGRVQPVATSVDVSGLLDAIAKVPTAEQNGAAARAAIVK